MADVNANIGINIDTNELNMMIKMLDTNNDDDDCYKNHQCVSKKYSIFAEDSNNSDNSDDIHKNENGLDHDHYSYNMKDIKIEDKNHKKFSEFLEKIDNFFCSYINSRKFHLFSIFFENFISLISEIEDVFLDDIYHLQNKIINYRFRHSYDQFRKFTKTGLYCCSQWSKSCY